MSGHNRNLVLAAVVACMSGSLFGYSVGFIGGILVLPSFLHHFRFDELAPRDLANAQAFAVTSWLIGTVFGVLVGLPLYSRLGRKACLTASALLYIAGACLQLVETGGNIFYFDTGRIINGLGVGAGTLVSPLYISEIATPELRGTLVSGYQVAIQLSALIGFWGAYVSDQILPETSLLQYKIPVALQLVPGILLAVGTCLIPEAPRFLAEKGKMDALRASVAWLRGLHQDDIEVVGESDDLVRSVEATQRKEQLNKVSFFTEIRKPSMKRRLATGIGLMVAQNLVGLNAVNYFAPVIIKSAGFTSITSMLFLTGMFGFVKVVAAVAFMLVFVRQMGNRFWLKTGTTACGISMFVLAICIRSMPSEPSSEPTQGSGLTFAGVLSILAIYVFAFAFGVSLGPISWNVCGEIFPPHLATKCCTITTVVQWLFQIVIASMTPPLITAIGWGTYAIYGVFCFMSLAWCWAYVPETRGVPLGQEMDQLFEVDGKEDDGLFGTVEEIEDVEDADETTQLLQHERKWRRRSSVALHV